MKTPEYLKVLITLILWFIPFLVLQGLNIVWKIKAVDRITYIGIVIVGLAIFIDILYILWIVF